MNICAVESVEDEILNMFKCSPIGLLVVCYYFSEVKASVFYFYFNLYIYPPESQESDGSANT